MSIEKQPMETALKDGGWVLGLVAPDGPTERERHPWVVMTWGDGGWCDDGGDERHPCAWVPLPDPQPENTGWMPPEGTIRVVEITGDGWKINGKPSIVPYRWIVQIEKLDGSLDEYREWWPYANQQEADEKASRWAKEFGLPVVIVPLPPSPSNVVQLRGPKGGTFH